MGAKQRGVRRIDPKLASRILRTVSIEEAFLFFTDIGNISANSHPPYLISSQN